jgi:hypothetical protein
LPGSYFTFGSCDLSKSKKASTFYWVQFLTLDKDTRWWFIKAKCECLMKFFKHLFPVISVHRDKECWYARTRMSRFLSPANLSSIICQHLASSVSNSLRKSHFLRIEQDSRLSVSALLT